MSTRIRPHRGLRYSIIMIAIGIIISVGIILIISANLAANFLDTVTSNGCESDYPELIEAVAQIKLPSSATDLRSSCRSTHDHAAAYFDMKPSDLVVFVNSTNVKMPLSTTGKPEKLNCRLCNDLPDLTSYLYGTYSAEEWFEEIFIDTSNPAQFRVYFTLLAG